MKRCRLCRRGFLLGVAGYKLKPFAMCPRCVASQREDFDYLKRGTETRPDAAPASEDRASEPRWLF